MLFTVDDRGGFQAWDLKKGESLWKVEQKMPKVEAFDAGKDLVTFHHGMAMASFLDAQTGEPKSGIGGTTAMLESRCLAADPDDRWIWIGTDKGGVTRVVPGSVNSWSNRSLGNGAVLCLAMDARGDTLAAGGQDGTVRFVGAKSTNVDDKRVLDQGTPVTAVALDAKGKVVASGAANGEVRVWKVTGKKPQHVLASHGSTVSSLAFDPKGARLASGDADGAICIWDVRKGEKVASLKLDRAIGGLVFLDKGKSLAAVGGGKTVTVWDVSGL